MRGNVLEINESRKYAGRNYIRFVLHEIYSSKDEWNHNGITWLEQYVRNNMESAIDSPLAVEFLDSWDKDEPLGHGFSGIEDGKPQFVDSVVVGTITDVQIQDVEVNGRQIRALVGDGVLYNQRYPKFIKWLKSKMYDGDTPDTSVEISAKEDNETIVYAEGWKEEGRIPSEYDYSGSAILGIKPADDSAVLLELNNIIKEDANMAKGNEELVVELNNKIDSKNTEISQLKEDLGKEKETVKEVNTKLEGKTEELNSTVEELKEVKENLSKKEKELEELTSEINKLKEFKTEQEGKELTSELNGKLDQYSKEEKEVAKEKIETFSKEPSKDLMNEIINEINSEIAKKIVEKRSKQTTEQNNDKNAADDIFSDVMETNSDDTATSIDDLL